eukprot:scaffold37643_cov164-Skeletonema_marinoi.AAC.2
MNFTTSAALSGSSSSVLSSASSSPSNYSLPKFLLFPFSIEHHLPSLAVSCSNCSSLWPQGKPPEAETLRVLNAFSTYFCIAFPKKINRLGDTYF